MKLVELLNANGVLTKMADKEMKYGVARKIAKNLKIMAEEVEAFEAERNKIAQENTVNGEVDQEAFYKKINEILATEVEVNGLANFYEHEMESLAVSPKDLIFIDFLIKENVITPTVA